MNGQGKVYTWSDHALITITYKRCSTGNASESTPSRTHTDECEPMMLGSGGIVRARARSVWTALVIDALFAFVFVLLSLCDVVFYYFDHYLFVKSVIIMEWKNELSLRLIDEYQKRPVLWNNKDGSYYSKNRKQEAWEEIAASLNVDLSEAKQKMNSLLGSFRREKSRGRRTIANGKGSETMYVSKWFAFERMRFLLYKEEPTDTFDTIDSFPKEADVDPGVDIFLNENSLHEANIFQTQQNTDNVNMLLDHQFSSHQQQRKKRTKKSTPTVDSRIKEAIGILQSVVATPEDSCSSFGKYIGEKLRQYNSRTQALVQHSINNILFDADMGKFEETSEQQYPEQFLMPSPSVSPALSPSNSIHSPEHQESAPLDVKIDFTNL